jgi:hypothetical protein
VGNREMWSEVTHCIKENNKSGHQSKPRLQSHAVTWQYSKR